MLPGYSGVVGNPLLTEALATTRAELLADKGLAAVADRAPDPFPAGGVAKRLSRWAPEVRVNLCLSELLESVQFEFQPAAGGDRACAKITHNDQTVVEIRQPTRDYIVNRQFAHVSDRANQHRRERMAEILAQVVPPVSFVSAIVGLHPDRHPRTMELLEACLRFAYALAMRCKDALDVPRPVDLSSQLQPMLLTPGHASLPSGHATEAFIAAEVLAAVCGLGASTRRQLRLLAHRIADNRVVAGLHYPWTASPDSCSARSSLRWH
jgi:hypothetical protein